MSAHIAINARYTHRRFTGVERYATELSSRLSQISREIKPSHPLNPIAGHLWEQLILPSHLQSNEVLWSPANTSAWTIRRQAVTIHDASPLDHPEWFNQSFGAWTRLSWRILAKTAHTILTVSNFSRERLKEHLGIPDSKLHVVYDGVGKPFRPQSQNLITKIREKYSLKKPYFLFVGTQEPRKNLKTVFQAWEMYLSSNTDCALVIAGKKGTVFSTKGVGNVLNLTYVQFLDYVPDDDLPALYSDAFAVLVPSLYEGFGLTALEAMACGTPVIASNTTSFPEVIGDVALPVNPTSAKEIANAMQQISDDRALANTLSERGIKHASQFTWDESASKIQSLLKSLS
jgi:glycosyltransferase involved in cell wall biosynthesis